MGVLLCGRLLMALLLKASFSRPIRARLISFNLLSKSYVLLVTTTMVQDFPICHSLMYMYVLLHIQSRTLPYSTMS